MPQRDGTRLRHCARPSGQYQVGAGSQCIVTLVHNAFRSLAARRIRLAPPRLHAASGVKLGGPRFELERTPKRPRRHWVAADRLGDLLGIALEVGK